MSEPEPTKLTIQKGVFATALATAANVLLLLAAKATLNIPASFRPASIGRVVFLTVLGAIGATVAWAFIQRRFDDPPRTFVNTAVVVLLLSFIPDLALLLNRGIFEGTTAAAVATLMVLHVVAASIIVPTLVWGRWSSEGSA